MHHTNTLTYRRAMELIELCAHVLTKLPTGFGFLADQLRRSSASVALNFSEGNAKASPKERRRYFRIAKGSALESAAAFDIAFRFQVIDSKTNQSAQDLCDHLGALLHMYR